jgi:hypothetical protein
MTLRCRRGLLVPLAELIVPLACLQAVLITVSASGG